MELIADTNTFLAVALNEPEKEMLVRATEGYDLIAPSVLPYEIGNALSALVKRRVLSGAEMPKVWDEVQRIPVELVSIDIRAALLVAGQFNLYAYDAYFLQCAMERRLPLLSLDKRVGSVAEELGITVLE